MSRKPRSQLVEPGSREFGTDAGESALRNWKARNERRCPLQSTESECNRPGATATGYSVPVPRPRRVHVGKRPARHHCSNLQLGQRPNEALCPERGNGRLAPADSAASTAAPSQSVEWETRMHALAR